MNMQWFPKRIRILNLIFLALFLVPLIVQYPFLFHIMILIGIWIVCTDSLNLVTGFAGQLALGQAAFVMIGGYAGALIMLRFDIPFWIAWLMGGGISFVCGLILGLMALRLRGDYLGMVTLGFGEIIRIFAINWIWLTRGASGLPRIPRPTFFGYTFSGELPYYFLMIAFVIVIHYTIERLVLSRFGRACIALRDDEVAASAMGVESYGYKVKAFCFASGMAGLAGVYYASWITMLSPNSFTLNDSLSMTIMETLGGIGSLYGSVPGAVIIGGIPELLRPFTTGPGVASLRFTLMGILLVILMIVRPKGLYGISIRRGYISLKPIRRFLVKQNSDDSEDENIQFDCALDDRVIMEIAKEREVRKLETSNLANDKIALKGAGNG
jgi:branched-chain amino acid transport system permease protein